MTFYVDITFNTIALWLTKVVGTVQWVLGTLTTLQYLALVCVVTYTLIWVELLTWVHGCKFELRVGQRFVSLSKALVACCSWFGGINAWAGKIMSSLCGELVTPHSNIVWPYRYWKADGHLCVHWKVSPSNLLLPFKNTFKATADLLQIEVVTE